MRPLIIEDSTEDAQVIAAQLIHAGLCENALFARSRDDLRDALEQNAFDLVVSGDATSGFDTLEALRTVRAVLPHVPFIAICGLLGEERMAEIIRAGANDVVFRDRLFRLPTVAQREVREANALRERHALQLQLWKTEQRVGVIFDQAPIGIAIGDVEGRLIRANSRLANILGYSPHELAGRHHAEFGHPDDAMRVRLLQKRLVNGELSSATYDGRYLRKDGEVVCCNVSLTAVRSSDGTFDYFLALVEDITERRRAEKKLLAREAQLEEAQRVARVGSWEYDFQTGQRCWSAEVYRIYGFERSCPTDVNLTDRAVHPDDRARFAEVRALILEHHQACDLDYRIVVGEDIKHLRLSGTVELTADGSPLRAFGVIQDVTTERLQEERIRQHALHQSAIAKVGQVALATRRIDRTLWEVVNACREVLGADLAAVWVATNEGDVLREGVGWSDDDPPGLATKDALGGVPLTGNVALVDFTKTEAPPFLARQGVRMAAIVPVRLGEDAPLWGTIAAYWRTPMELGGADVNFLSGLSLTLMHAVERDEAERALNARVRQQSAIAELGRRALSGVDDAVLARTCNLVRLGLGCEYSLFLEAQPSDAALLYRAGSRWLDDPPKPISVSESQAGYTLRQGEPVVVVDYEAESRFDSSCFTKGGVRSGLTVPVMGAQRTFGVLTAQSRQRGAFRLSDAHFMQAVASLLAEGLERDAMRLQLVESEHRFRTVIEGAAEIIFMLSPTGLITSLNPAFEAITGFAVDSWIGRNVLDLVHPDDRDAMVGVFLNVLHGQRVEMSVRLLDREGHMLVVEASIFGRREQDRITAVYGFARDVTGVRETEHQRDRLVRDMALLLESTEQGIYATDVHGVCTLVNRAAERMLGYRADQLLGSEVHALVHHTSTGGTTIERIECPIASTLSTGDSCRVADDMFWRADGSSFAVEYAAAPIIDEGKIKGIVVSFNDVTQQRRLEAQLDQVRRVMSLGRLAATIAHEFNNVLMGIGPFAEVLRRNPEDPVRVRAACEHIFESIHRGKRITDEILRFTRQTDPELAPVRVAEWLDKLRAEARSVLSPSVQLRINPVDPELAMLGDASQLHQVVMNLLLNARDAMNDAGTIVVHAGLGGDAGGAVGAESDAQRYIHISVRDDGPGMPSEILAHVFEPLFTTKANGTGLGLAIAHQVVQRHNGSIFVDSAQGRGTTFHVYVPVATDVVRKDEVRPITSRASGRALVVEDDPSVAAGIAALLELEGLETMVVDRGSAVLGAIDEFHPDVVILDLGLPDMNGVDVFRQIAARYPRLPVVFSTGHGDELQLEAYLAHPHVAFLQKPYDVSALLLALHDVLEVREAVLIND